MAKMGGVSGVAPSADIPPVPTGTSSKSHVEVAIADAQTSEPTPLEVEPGEPFDKRLSRVRAARPDLPEPRDILVDLAPGKICIESLLKAEKDYSALVPR